MKKNKRPSRSPSRPQGPDEIRASIESLTKRCQQLWQEEVIRNVPNWGVLLGLHVRLAELEYLESAVEESLL